MSGVKGRSGRRSLREEGIRITVIDKAWKRINKLLDDETDKQAIIAATSIVVKDMVNKLEGKGFDTKLFIQNFRGIVEAAVRNGRPGNTTRENIRNTEFLETESS